MWFNPRELQQQHTPGDLCDFSDFLNSPPLKVAEIAKVATPSLLKIEEREAILDWLESISETNAEAIAGVIRRCQEDSKVRNYFLGVAMAHKGGSTKSDDDRRSCHQCINLSSRGHCLAAWRGEIQASRDYRPMGNLPLRCEGYQPKADDPDQRQARERWPGLFNKK
jgi:hypothetical protein